MTEKTNGYNVDTQFNIMDALFYVLAGGSMAVISVSFLLWLRF